MGRSVFEAAVLNQSLARMLGFAAVALCVLYGPAMAADFLDPTPVAEQDAPLGNAAVDGVNVELGLLGGAFDRNVLDTASNYMVTATIATPLPFFSQNFGIQADLSAGIYDDDFTSSAAALHIFWRDPDVGMLGAYGDWAYVDPEHGGRVGAEGALYNGRFSLDVLVGFQFGQHFETEFIDEVDLSYYFTDNFRASIGHRYISRGNVGNVSFEAQFEDPSLSGFSVFGEIEAGEDSYVAGWGGVRWAFGTGTASSLIERDRRSTAKVRIPRNLASVTQCGELDVPRPATSLRDEQSNVCSSEDEINAVSSTGITKK